MTSSPAPAPSPAARFTPSETADQRQSMLWDLRRQQNSLSWRVYSNLSFPPINQMLCELGGVATAAAALSLGDRGSLQSSAASTAETKSSESSSSEDMLGSFIEKSAGLQDRTSELGTLMSGVAMHIKPIEYSRMRTWITNRLGTVYTGLQTATAAAAATINVPADGGGFFSNFGILRDDLDEYLAADEDELAAEQQLFGTNVSSILNTVTEFCYYLAQESSEGGRGGSESSENNGGLDLASDDSQPCAAEMHRTRSVPSESDIPSISTSENLLEEKFPVSLESSDVLEDPQLHQPQVQADLTSTPDDNEDDDTADYDLLNHDEIEDITPSFDNVRGFSVERSAAAAVAVKSDDDIDDWDMVSTDELDGEDADTMI
ncbi:hypothetical protein BZA70DRAFT_286498 [Myxozyma melibiosi]|uniref:Uncharacterized protein n=1 Tax=Myxozyma melibiosi TaxID=54550 RepID=A0ABR1FB93_9ASCO